MNIYLEKVRRSALITLSGMVVTIVPVLTGELVDYVQNNDPIDLRTAAILAIGASSTWIVNTGKKTYDYLSSQSEAKD